MAMESPEEKKIEKKAAIPSETLLSWRDLMHHVAAVFKFMWKLIKSILTSIPTTAMVFFVFSAFTGWGFYMFHGSVNRQFDSLFDERYTSTNPVCYGREDFKQNLKMLIDSPNPKGVIFVSGSKNSGKTTAIKSALQGRRHVTYINLREKDFAEEKDLVHHLKVSFKIVQYKDWMVSLSPMFGWIIECFFYLPTLLNSKRDYYALEEVLDEIETILKYAYRQRGSSRITERPVIFIDEIGKLQPMVNDPLKINIVKKLINWMIKVTKDSMLCDVIFSSHDGFAMQTLSLADGLYAESIMIPEMTQSEIKGIVEKYPRKMCGKYIQYILQHLGYLGSHVYDSLLYCDKKSLNQYIESMRLKERHELDNIKKLAQKVYFYKNADFSAYTEDDYRCIFDRLLEKRQANSSDINPAIPLYPAMTKFYKCDLNVIKYFSNQGWLLYDPSRGVVQARNKPFLDVYEFDINADAEIRSLERQLREERSRLEYDSLEPPDYERIAMLEEQLQGMNKMNITKK